MPVRILIFEDNDGLRHSLATLLNSTKDYEVVGDFAAVEKVNDIMENHFPDVVIMDIDMPGKDGIWAVPIIKEIKPEIAIIMYTQYEDDDKLFRSIRAGADGYILKKTPPQMLFEAIEEVWQGGAPLSPSIAKRVMASFREPLKKAGTQFTLTPKETEILHYLTKGYSVKFIASELSVSYETIKSHLRNIYRKLHVNCGKEAIAKILAEKINL